MRPAGEKRRRSVLQRGNQYFHYTDAMSQILGSSISYRIAVGPQQGQKAFVIRTIRPLDRSDPGLERVARANGFSLHAGVSCEGHQKSAFAGTSLVPPSPSPVYHSAGAGTGGYVGIALP